MIVKKNKRVALQKSKQKIRQSAAATGIKFLNNADYLPDPMNSGLGLVGAKVDLPVVGVSRLLVPFKVEISKDHSVNSCVSFIASVSLDADKRGINMSRILRVIDEFTGRPLNPALLSKIALHLRDQLESNQATLRAEFQIPMEVSSLRSSHKGVQYYQACFEVSLLKNGTEKQFIELDFAYSSACPCSAALSRHSEKQKSVYAIPHSQRSKARVRLQLKKGQYLSLTEISAVCRDVLKTETQVIVRRIDEQAFAELNADNQKFVEDAVRLLFEAFDNNRRIVDFKLLCMHFESLHSHNAVASVCKGIPSGMRPEISEFSSISES